MSSAILMPSTNSVFCGNCHQQIGNETSRATFKCKNFYGPSQEEIQIFEAIAYIYGITWNEFVTYSKSYPEKNFDNGEILTSVSFCILCSRLLSNNYVSLKRLENVCHPSSIVHKINTFRQLKYGQSQSNSSQQNETPENYSSPENEISESCDSPPDNDYDDNDELFNSFNISDKDKHEEQPEIEVKYEPFDRGSFQKPEVFLATKSLRSRQLFIKLDRLPEEQFTLNKSLKERKKKRIKTTRNTPLKKRTDKILVRDELKDEDYVQNKSDANANENRKPKLGKRKRSDPTETEKCECKICGKKVQSVEYYKKVHLPGHYKKLAKCLFCEKELPKKGMKKHIADLHSIDNGKAVTCPVCKKRIVSYNIDTHMKMFHSGPRQTYKCEKCDKVYFNKQMHSEHMLTHSEQFTPYLCGICGKVFKLKCTFDNHLKRHERGKMKVRKFICDQCPLEFPGFSTLKEHKAKVHFGQRTFICQECGKSYKWKRQLVQHVKLHNELKEKGEKRAKCEKCNVYLKHSLSLAKHNLRFHKDSIKVFDCSFCARRFTCATYLRKHEQQHKDNPNFAPAKRGRISKLFKDKSTAEDDESENQNSQKNFVVCTLETFKPAR